MIYHYYDPLSGMLVWNQPRTETNYPVWTSRSGHGSIHEPQISIVKSDKLVTLVIRDNDGKVVTVVDLTPEEAGKLAAKLTNDNNT